MADFSAKNKTKKMPRNGLATLFLALHFTDEKLTRRDPTD